ncbi:hypothetical protein Spica_2562 [Gracilinema caldarium DSM 7334]|uniref:Uracil-DNA glycosylase n=2 Tax=Gracilinema caldarium TaxID=215591 RepID=F8EY02_GRAC1|nr:hypothetical protein Spica_2562 [Gracilinema caldarium DSM 7334]
MTKSDGTPGNRAPDCLKCVYFRVSWDPAFPRLCTVFGIKTKHLPSIEVFQATGHHCPSFMLKKGLT